MTQALRIPEFLALQERYPGIYDDVLANIEDDITFNAEEGPSLTGLQEKALASEAFFSDQRPNLVIQGATSSGKTLVAEFLAMQEIFQRKKNVIYLVPLKALIHEKVQTFRKHFNEGAATNLRIYGSSSDYQDHDEEIARGSYDIAVIVYEKFFAMLAERSESRMLKDCELIVIDEFQMIERRDRGPKLEYAITKVMNSFGTRIRIAGLTTIDCNAEQLVAWLKRGSGAPAASIQDDTRPVPLHESIVSLDGHIRTRTVSKDGKATEKGGGAVCTFEPPPASNRKDKKLPLLKHLLCTKIFAPGGDKGTDTNAQKKVIIFCSSRHDCPTLAEAVAATVSEHHLLPRQELSPAMDAELARNDDGDETQKLRKDLLPFGVAFHNASIPMSLREMIEDEFRGTKESRGSIQILVATETITIGVNLPADVMILYDHTIYRDDEYQDLKPQEYKNYIGRAGRLGLARFDGESYLIVERLADLAFYWNKYVECQKETIQSSLCGADAELLAPYYLNLLSQQESLTADDIRAVSQKTLSAVPKKDAVNPDDIIQKLSDSKKYKLIYPKPDSEDEEEEEEELDETGEPQETAPAPQAPVRYVYALTELGRPLAPYAFSLETSMKIRQYFYQAGWKGRTGKHGGLPLGCTGDWLQQGKYLLDILYTVCRMPEVERHRHPLLDDSASGSYHEAKNALVNFFRQRTAEDFWADSALWKLFEHPDIDTLDCDTLRPVYRAVLLYHWLQGLPLHTIKGMLHLKHCEILTSDMFRIAGTCSYILEAIGRAAEANTRRWQASDTTAAASAADRADKRQSNAAEDIALTRSPGLKRGFYTLSLKVKYGLDDANLRLIASRHVYGLSRSTILKLGNLAKEDERYDNVLHFLNSGDRRIRDYLTPRQRSELDAQLHERYHMENIDDLIETFDQDTMTVASCRDVLLQLAHAAEGEDAWQGALDAFLRLVGCPRGDTVRVGRLAACTITDGPSAGCQIVADWRQDNRPTTPDALAALDERLPIPDGKRRLRITNRPVGSLADEELRPGDTVFLDAKTLVKYYILARVNGIENHTGERLLAIFFHVQQGGIVPAHDHIEDDIRAFVAGTDDTTSDREKPFDAYCAGKFRYERTIYGSSITEGSVLYLVHSTQAKDEKHIIKQIPIPAKGEVDALREEARRLRGRFDGAAFDLADVCEQLHAYQHERWPFLDEGWDAIQKGLENRYQNLTDVARQQPWLPLLQTFCALRRAYARKRELSLVMGASEKNGILAGTQPELIFRNHPAFDSKGDRDHDNRLQGYLYFLMAAKAHTLEDFTASGKRLPDAAVAQIGADVCTALTWCHEKRHILHCDVKCANILYDEDDGCFLTDFGLAMRIGEQRYERVGTERYFAPEIAQAEEMGETPIPYTPASDIYALGVTLGNIAAHPGAKLAACLAKACAERKEERYASAREMGEALRAIGQEAEAHDGKA